MHEVSQALIAAPHQIRKQIALRILVIMLCCQKVRPQDRRTHHIQMGGQRSGGVGRQLADLEDPIGVITCRSVRSCNCIVWLMLFLLWLFSLSSIYCSYTFYGSYDLAKLYYQHWQSFFL
jgi:hypothetical protein